MDLNSEQLELEEGEIDELEDGEIEDDETNETEVKTVSKVTPSSNVDCDFSRHPPSFQDERPPHFSPKIPQHPRRRENVPSPRYNNNESWPKRVHNERPAFHFQDFSPNLRPSFPRSNRGMYRGKQRRILQTIYCIFYFIIVFLFY